MITYNKIVRDKIPRIIESKGKTCQVHELDSMSFIFKFRDKLQEEVDELHRAATQEEVLEEVVDVLEVIRTIAQNAGIGFEEIERARLKKRQEKGGFDKRLFLEYVD